MIIALLFLVLAIYLSYRYLKDLYGVFERDGLPGPKPTFLLGNIPEFAKHKNPFDTLFSLTKRYGKVFGYFEGLTPSIVVTDPMMIEQILVKRFHQFDERPNYWVFQHGAEEQLLQNLNGPTWKSAHRVLASATNSSAVNKMWPQLLCASNKYLNSLTLARKENTDGFLISRRNLEYLLDCITSVLLNSDQEAVSEQDKADILEYIHAAHYSVSPEYQLAGLARVYPFLAPLLKWFDKDHGRLAAKHSQFISDLLRKEKAKMTNEGALKHPSNVLQHLLSASCATTDGNSVIVRNPFSEDALCGLVSSFYVAGVGSADSLLSFAVYCLALNPAQQEKLREDINAALGDEETIDMKRLQRIEYLDMFIYETLRHFPVAPGVARMCGEDCTVAGVKFRKGMAVRLLGSANYKDTQVFPDPETFKPERFSAEERRERHPFSFVPLGGGPRQCVGGRLGWLMVQLALVTLLRHFRVTPCAGTQVPLAVAHRPFLCPRDGVTLQLLPLGTAA